MLYLSNNKLRIGILDPEMDEQRLGSRYCRGCYIWQVESVAFGPLFSGPAYPESHPPVFDGQGIPDVFESALGSEVARVGEPVHVIGVGDVLRSSAITPFHVRWNPTVVASCQWAIGQKSDMVEMSTEAAFRGYGYHLTKRITLDESGWTIRINIANTGSVPIPVRWFLHPFFPLNNRGISCSLSLPLTIPDNPGFRCDGEHHITMIPAFDWKNGCYRTISVPWNQPVSVTVEHPAVKSITFKTSYGLSWLPIWANANTFSIEPFFTRFLIPGESGEWMVVFTMSEI